MEFNEYPRRRMTSVFVLFLSFNTSETMHVIKNSATDITVTSKIPK